MTDDHFLIEILAATDAVIAPLRRASWEAAGWAAFRQDMLANYRTTGLPWTGPGDSTERSRQQRQVEKLAAADLVFKGSSTATRLSVGLTDRGESRARALCHWSAPDYRRGLEILEDLVEGEKPESDFIEANYGDPGAEDQLGRLQCVLLPFYFRNLVQAFSTAAGHAYLSLPRSFIAATITDLFDADTAPLDRGGDLYYDAITAHRRRLRNFAANEIRFRQEIGPIPRQASRR